MTTENNINVPQVGDFLVLFLMYIKTYVKFTSYWVPNKHFKSPMPLTPRINAV